MFKNVRVHFPEQHIPQVEMIWLITSKLGLIFITIVDKLKIDK